MPYIGSSPPATALTSSDIADSIITEAKMADDAISLTELKAGTDGEVISWDASGNPVAIGAGTSGHFLKSQGAGSQPVFAAAGGGSWTFINKTTISDDSEVDIESGIDSTYPLYAFIFNKVHIQTDDKYLQCRVKVSSYQTGSDYRFGVKESRSGGTSWDNDYNTDDGGTEIRMINANAMGNDATTAFNGILYLPHPADTVNYKIIWWTGTYIRANNQLGHTQGMGAYHGGAGAVTGLRFFMNSGNLTTGTISLYGIKDS